MARIRTSRVLARYGQWVVTTYGIECTTTPYAIERERVHKVNWGGHMAEKNWVNMQEFFAALVDAQGRWPNG
jgi:hypothetical protein